ncbi:flagellar hook length control protein FliK [Citrobacter amalonaticus]|uniref:flagellar hook length control protein FliK n=1 Tax=Citrobacter amalonaticus TaxID=35703 RepID=UPI00255B1E48|nr:flagellar hook length control protein FliK [Citrobacter amalonaticus]MDL4619014.1 flagellar hook length control protein FliK [Citrobacter amalonaticus]MDL4623112.1 flagellar hook length control protein FliK [Citrobacter amalonaticus]
MITLPQQVTTDTDLITGLSSGKTADSAQDFLALLAGALGAGNAQGKDAPLTLADLQAASGKLQKGLLAQDGDASQTVKLADLLAAKEGQSEALQKGLSDAQALLSTLTPTQKNSALAALRQSAQKDEGTAALSDDDLANLSALFAMLPGQPGMTTPPVTTGEKVSALSTDPRSLAQGATSPLTRDDAKKSKTDNATPVIAAESAKGQAVTTPVVAAAAANAEIDSTPSPVTPGIAMTTTTHSASQPPPTSAAPVLSAPLGSHEWQQSLSQHITLFTRQGQQSAELRLHPEELGQVQISLKLDDNQAQLQMVSAHSHVRAALEAALPTLRTQLAESGIQLGQSSISSESFAGQQHSSAQQQQTARTQGQDRLMVDDESELAVPASLQSAARGNGAVDIFA